MRTSPLRSHTRTIRSRGARTALGLAALAAMAACADPVSAPRSPAEARAARAPTRHVAVTDLGLVGEALSVAPNGAIAGDTERCPSRAAVWDRGRLTCLQSAAGGLGSRALGISPRGQVVGSMDVVRAGAGTVVALLWTKGNPVVLPSLPGVGSLPGDLSVASAISPGGDIVGSNWTHFFAVGPRSPRAVLWHDGQILNLSPTVGEPSMATAVNALGQIVGWTTPRQASALVRHAFLLADGRVTDLGTLGGSSSEAYGVNTRGQVVGYSKTVDGADHPFLWQNGVMSDLGTFGGRFNSQASAINARGQVVGWSTTGAGDSRAFLWEAGVMTDLGTLGGAHSRAYDISESGRIVGTAQTSDGRSHWVVWTVR